jgi:hypothetical protein
LKMIPQSGFFYKRCKVQFLFFDDYGIQPFNT